jgi:hypothetical protein
LYSLGKLGTGCSQSGSFARLDLALDLSDRLTPDDLQVVVGLHVEPVLR